MSCEDGKRFRVSRYLDDTAGSRRARRPPRGYGRSDVPEPVEAYAIDVLTADVVALVDAAGAQRAVVIGHDWGAEVAWRTAWLHPDRVSAVAGLM